MTTHHDERDVDAFLAGGGRSAAFPKIGTTVSGEVLSAELRDQTEFSTGEVKVWQDGTPRKQIVITIDTGEAVDEDDDGRRRVYAKGAMLKALRKALGKGRLLPGGHITVTYSGDGKKEKALNPPKLYTVQYTPPQPGVGMDTEGLDYEEEAPRTAWRDEVSAFWSAALSRARAYDPQATPRTITDVLGCNMETWLARGGTLSTAMAEVEAFWPPMKEA